MRNVCLFLLAGMIAAGPASAFEQASSTSEAKKEKRICREEPPLGSRLNVRRVCLTAAEWREVTDASRDEVNRFVDRAMAIQRPSGGTPR